MKNRAKNVQMNFNREVVEACALLLDKIDKYAYLMITPDLRRIKGQGMFMYIRLGKVFEKSKRMEKSKPKRLAITKKNNVKL